MEAQSPANLLAASDAAEVLAAAAEEFAGGRLLFSDVRVVLMLLNRGRFATLERVFGVPRDQANMVTVVGAAMLAGAARRDLRRVMTGPSPSAGDTALGGAIVREGLAGVAGLSTGRAGTFPPLLGLALLSGLIRPVRRWSARTVRAGSHQTQVMFRHRYGPLVRHHGRRLAAQVTGSMAPPPPA
jgi:hypothetical protein